MGEQKLREKNKHKEKVGGRDTMLLLLEVTMAMAFVDRARDLDGTSRKKLTAQDFHLYKRKFISTKVTQLRMAEA